ncbi:flagellar filament capping protein FliD [Granulicella sibirica]|uniref:Flagellar hook-associated protein 2 n=1 Tax=Granulicella sibirica TaxID=2479048 RepID=A0A4Q0SYQ6_9BACT|nr:flagellar filament capping protein FliD [Granulicella sibirica]RXH56355.1 Flagellar hook-associated protein FliD [Granulicella sibirica]
MATVGLNFGSATSGTGFDVSTTVSSILAIQGAIETPWKNQLATLQAQDTVLTTLGTDLSTLTTSIQSLTDITGVLASKQGSSSNTNVVALASADATATAGSHTVVVNSLATTASEYSDLVTDSSAVLSGSITIAGTTITIGSSNNTLASLAASINAADLGVNASVITDSTGSRLSLVSSTGGSAGQSLISGISGSLTYTTTSNTTPATLDLNAGQTGVNASLTVDGVNISSATNTITGAIPGVTFQALATGSSQIAIANDNSSVESAVSSFVTAYNAVIKDINGQEGNDATGAAEPLYGSPTLATVQSQLQSALSGGGGSGSITSIAQLGLSVNNDGTLTLNNATLDTTLNTSYSDVAGFLQNSGSFGQTVSSALNNLGTQAPDGLVYLAQQQNTSEEASLNASITKEDAVLATQKISLTNELNTANQILQSIPSQLNEINEIYSAVTGYNNQNG